MLEPARGLRNCNPGNIDRKPGVNWQGMADKQDDPRFVVFKSAQFGIRALARVLLNYQLIHKLDTLRKIINRWAPPNENDTDSYIRHVAADCGVDPDEPITLDSAAVMLPLAKAIITHENGRCPYSDTVLMEGLRLAGVHDAPAKPLHKQASFVSKAIGGGLVAFSAAGEYAEPLKHGADKLAPYASAAPIQKVITVLLTIAAICLTVSMFASWAKHKAGVP